MTFKFYFLDNSQPWNPVWYSLTVRIFFRNFLSYNPLPLTSFQGSRGFCRAVLFHANEEHYRWFSLDVIAAILVHRTIEKKSFGNLNLLLCKIRAIICYCFVHQHGRLITWLKTINKKELVPIAPCSRRLEEMGAIENGTHGEHPRDKGARLTLALTLILLASTSYLGRL